MECDDVLVPVRKEAEIRARLGLKDLLRTGFRPGGRIITFRVDGEEIAKVRAGWGGFARATFTPRQEKEYRVEAFCQGAGSSQAAVAGATIFSRGTEREAIILDIDRTLSGSSFFASVFKRGRKGAGVGGLGAGVGGRGAGVRGRGTGVRGLGAGVRGLGAGVRDDAVNVTCALARKYDLIVVTGRKTHLRRKTIRWLAEKGFPRAPVYFSSIGKFPFSHEKFKTHLIRELKHAWENITIGIGDRDSDARAYLANGLRAIILREKGRCPRGAILVNNWKGIAKILLQADFLTG